MQSFILPSCQIQPAKYLPLSLISLEEWSLISIDGNDSCIYLQGQLTSDMNTLKKTEHRLVAHCNAKGKIWSTLRLFHYNEGYAYVIRRSVCEKQLAALKKYSVFSKVNITIDNSILLGVAGFQARDILSKIFKKLPNINNTIITDGKFKILYFEQPTERFMLITTLQEANNLKFNIRNDALFSNSQQWLALDIEAGIPIIDYKTSEKFIPQDINLQLFKDAISFKKGCYSGQEIVSKMHFIGKSKLTLYWLSGKTNIVPTISSSMELQINNTWKRTGTVLSSVRITQTSVWLQVIMNNKINSNSILRLESDQDSRFTIQLV